MNRAGTQPPEHLGTRSKTQWFATDAAQLTSACTESTGLRCRSAWTRADRLRSLREGTTIHQGQPGGGPPPPRGEHTVCAR